MVLYLVDATVGLTDEDEHAAFSGVIIIYTKTDLAPSPAGELGISVTAERGVDELLSRLDVLVRDQFAAPEGSLVSERQRQAVLNCREALLAALGALDAGLEEQIVVVDLHRASTALGVLTGAISRDDVFTEIFTKFCIGK